MGVTSQGAGSGAGKNSGACASARRTAASARRIASSGGIFPAASRSAAEDLVPPGQAQPGAELLGAGLQRRDVVQAGLVQVVGRQRQRRVDADGRVVVAVPVGYPVQPRLLSGPRPRQQIPDRGYPPGQGRVHDIRHRRPAGRLPVRRARPVLRRRGDEDRAVVGAGQDRLGPGDGILRQRGDRQPPPPVAGPQLVGDLVEPDAAALDPGEEVLRCRLIQQDRPGRHREESGRSSVVHGGDGVVIGGQVDDRHFLGGGAPGAVQRDGVGGTERAAVDRVGLADESLGFGTPGPLARFAVVRKQVVVPGNPVHGGGERVDVQPARVETIGKIPCFSHETRILTGETRPPDLGSRTTPLPSAATCRAGRLLSATILQA